MRGLQYLLERLCDFDLPVQLKRIRDREEGVEPNDPHAFLQAKVCDQYADSPEPDHAERSSGELIADELLLVPFDYFLDLLVRIGVKAAGKLDGAEGLTGLSADHRHDELGDSPSLTTRGIGDANAELCRIVNGNVIDADPCPRDREAGELIRPHFRATDDERIWFFDFLSDDVVAVEDVQAYLRNIVHHADTG